MNSVSGYGLSRAYATSLRLQGACARLLTPVASARVGCFSVCRIQLLTHPLEPRRHIRTLTPSMSFTALEAGQRSRQRDTMCDVSQRSSQSVLSVQPFGVPLVPEQGIRCSSVSRLDRSKVAQGQSRQEQPRWRRLGSSSLYATGLALEGGQRFVRD